MSVSEIKLYNLLRSKMGEDQAQTLDEFIRSSVKDEFDTKKDIFSTKEDLANAKTDIIKWMFIFWVGAVGVSSGVMFAMLHAYLPVR